MGFSVGYSENEPYEMALAGASFFIAGFIWETPIVVTLLGFDIWIPRILSACLAVTGTAFIKRAINASARELISARESIDDARSELNKATFDFNRALRPMEESKKESVGKES